ncbi:MAG: DivIVA domain-containing protein, partial [Janibacter sp.]|nr:DivIVA domain-containing protein [Janibacter sp.]
MALTPEDVLNKTFTQTQFRRGYDEREVDDFLDEVVAEMRRMVKDSEDLRARTEDGSPAAAVAAGSSTSGTADEALTRENRDLRARLEDLRTRFDKETAARAAADKRVAALEQSAHTRDEQAKGDDAALGKAQQSADERVAMVDARAKEAEERAQQRIQAAN